MHLSPLVYPGFWEFLEKMSVFLRRNFAVLFVLFFILAFLPKFLNTFLQRLLVGICFVLAIVNTFLFLQFDSFLNAAFVEVLFLTRVAEINEFFSSYLTMKTGGGIALFIIISVLIFKLPFKKINIPNKYHLLDIFKILLFLLCLFQVIKKHEAYLSDDIILLQNYEVLSSVFGKNNKYVNELESLKKLLDDFDENNYSVTNKLKIPKVVLILGESTQRNYMSLYNYPLKTTPNLDKIKEEGNLFVFKDVISSHSNTNPALSRALTFMNYENASKPWFKHMNIVDLMKKAGYYTYWLSNQEAISVYGNAPESIARRAHKNLYIGKAFSTKSVAKDEGLIKELPNIKEDKDFEFYVFHLMGTHVSYEQRYPKNFDKFSEKDLQDNKLDKLNESEKLSKKQARIKSHYLNAVYYNDFVVSEIFKHFKDEEAIIFYFSDHGDEVYDFRDLYGHVHVSPSRYMAEIPFMIFLSDSFKSSYPAVLQRIQKAQEKAFMNDNFLHSFLDILGIYSKDYDETYSIFSQNYDEKRKRLYVESRDYDLELKQAYPFKAPAKIWLHRTNEIKKFEDFSKIYQNYEIDVYFLDNYFDVGHDGKDTSINLDLKTMLKLVSKRKEESGFEAKIWLDFKNLDENNKEKALKTLLQISKESDFDIKNFIIESRNYKALALFKEAGFYTSYYLTFNEENFDEKAKKHIQEVIDSKAINAISFPHKLYEKVKNANFTVKERGFEKDLDLLLWNHNKNFYANSQEAYFYDAQVKVILAGEKGEYR